MTASPPPGVTRRRVLAGAALAMPWLAGCSLGAGSASAPPDPLIALADAARADAALAAAAIAAAPELADRVRPLVDARAAHATALDAEVARLDPDRATPTAPPTPAPTPAGDVSVADQLAQVRSAVHASAEAAATLALELPVERVGLVASVAACCATYAAVLG
jgi:hypothetical protein